MRRHAYTLAATAALVLLIAARALGAGTYEVSACNFAPEGVNNSWVWSSSDPSPQDHYTRHESCPDRHGGTGGTADQEAGLSTTDTLGLANGAPTGTKAGWTATAPPGTTIVGLISERYIGRYLDGYNSWSPALRADGTILPGETCLDTVENAELCYVGGPPDEGEALDERSGLHAHELTIGIGCEAPPEIECITGSKYHAVWATIYGADLILEDPTPPTLAQPTGPLWQTGQQGHYSKGTETITTSATDIGGGIQSITINVDGTTRSTWTAPCNFTKLVPCPPSTGPQTLPLPTTELPDGTHTIEVAAHDAAGNTSQIAAEHITTANQPAPEPENLTVTEATNNTLSAHWHNPANPAIPIDTALYQLCPANSQTCSQPQTAPAEGPATIAIPSPGTWAINVWLINAAGNESNKHASTTITTHPTTPPTPETPPTTPPPNSPAGSLPSPKKTLRITATRHHTHVTVRLHNTTPGERLTITCTAWKHGHQIGRIRRILTAASTNTSLTITLNHHLATAHTITIEVLDTDTHTRITATRP